MRLSSRQLPLLATLPVGTARSLDAAAQLGGAAKDAPPSVAGEPFGTTKPKGSISDLGLTMRYEIVTRGHGGTLTAEDAPRRRRGFRPAAACARSAYKSISAWP
ncbi:MAG: hypothetical protein AAFU38_11825 [Bacteroidota bacterium]